MTDKETNPWYPPRYMAALLWLGFVLAISFMEAPLKFRAPSVTLPIGLEIGRLVFGALNKVEWGLLATMVLSLVLAPSNRASKALVTGLGILLAVQTFYLLPILGLRTDLILAGGMPPPSSLHLVYIVLDVAKVFGLIAASLHFVYRPPN